MLSLWEYFKTEIHDVRTCKQTAHDLYILIISLLWIFLSARRPTTTTTITEAMVQVRAGKICILEKRFDVWHFGFGCEMRNVKRRTLSEWLNTASWCEIELRGFSNAKHTKTHWHWVSVTVHGMCAISTSNESTLRWLRLLLLLLLLLGRSKPSSVCKWRVEVSSLRKVKLFTLHSHDSTKSNTARVFSPSNGGRCSISFQMFEWCFALN